MPCIHILCLICMPCIHILCLICMSSIHILCLICMPKSSRAITTCQTLHPKAASARTTPVALLRLFLSWIFQFTRNSSRERGEGGGRERNLKTKGSDSHLQLQLAHFRCLHAHLVLHLLPHRPGEVSGLLLLLYYTTIQLLLYYYTTTTILDITSTITITRTDLDWYQDFYYYYYTILLYNYYTILYYY